MFHGEIRYRVYEKHQVVGFADILGAPWWTTPECFLLVCRYEIAARSDDDVDRLFYLLFALPWADSVVAPRDRRSGGLFDQYLGAYDLHAAYRRHCAAAADCDDFRDCGDSGVLELGRSVDYGEYYECDQCGAVVSAESREFNL